ncbi:TetR/AcrR family transcriptional regulator [Shouchella sp. 1P09AA]|uniref:TetR/AcrR family transcriptional regulator n=1 Tax=unclassified Shouchella TaxID=2893065 RepID=UPI0039A29D0A
MARRKLNKEDIFAATDTLLHESGYEGFHFKPLASMLEVGRSTIYEYYPNKEDLLVAYMSHIMEAFLRDQQEIPLDAPVCTQLEQLIYLFMKHDRILLAIDLTPHVEKRGNEQVQLVLKQLWKHHREVFHYIHTLVENGIQVGEIRKDLPAHLIETLIFQSISLNKARKEETKDQWAAAISDLILKGIRPQ